jgi:probable HAF family extracellular repeat protein
MSVRHTLTGLAMLVVALGPGSRVANADNGPYSIQDAGPSGNAVGRGVNATGVVVGTSDLGAFRTAFGSGSELLAGLPSTTPVFAYGVHDAGWAVGSSGWLPVRFTTSAEKLLPEPLMGEGMAANAQGDVAGYAVFTGFRAFVWLAGGSGGQELSMGLASSAAAINDGRVVTGQVVTGTGQGAAFRWTLGGGAVALPTLGGGSGAGRGINNAGDIVGESFRAGEAWRIAAWWKPNDDVVDLGTLGGAESSAADVNNHGQIVGWSLNGSGERRAFLYTNGTMVDLNALLEPGSGWVLLSANAINDAGQITGEGLVGTDVKAFLLTPPVNSDTTPPVISAAVASPGSVWPPRHQLVEVAVSVSATDDSGEVPVCRITGVSASEPENGVGDGDTVGDAFVTGPLTAQVRAERSGPAGSRIYTLAVECVDGSGNAAQGAATVVIGEASVLSAKAKGKK